MSINVVKKAQSLCRQYGTTDPFRLCKEKDIVVLMQDMPRQLKGMTVTKKRIRFIYINSLLFLQEKEREFVCGHELGHIFLGHDENVIFSKANTLKVQNKEENEADLFSTSILLDRYTMEDLKTMTVEQVHLLTGIESWMIRAYMDALGGV